MVAILVGELYVSFRGGGGGGISRKFCRMGSFFVHWTAKPARPTSSVAIIRMNEFLGSALRCSKAFPDHKLAAFVKVIQNSVPDESCLTMTPLPSTANPFNRKNFISCGNDARVAVESNVPVRILGIALAILPKVSVSDCCESQACHWVSKDPSAQSWSQTFEAVLCHQRHPVVLLPRQRGVTESKQHISVTTESEIQL